MQSVEPLNSTESEQIKAYALGWNTAQDWTQPHLNPFLPFTVTWYAWYDGYCDGKKQPETLQ